MRGRKALANIISSLALQLVTVVCGFIVPRLILETFGSDVNGTISSITEFLGYIVLFESGVGGVIKAALYKPLANKDISALSGIIKATEKFFRAIAYIFIAYLFIVAVFYPYLVKNKFDWLYTFALVLIIGVSTFVQYYYGITYQIMIQADQKMYFTSLLQIVTLIINTILVAVLIKFGAGIHIVKLGSSLIFVVRPFVMNLYVKRRYKIIENCSADNNAIKQRWDGFGQHLAYFIHTNTDVVVLTVFTNVGEVSVYSVYLMIVSSMERIFSSISNGLTAAIGNMIARDEQDLLNRTFNIYEFVSFTVTTVLFTSTSFLIVPFVSVYTQGITDENYYRPLFAYLLTASEAVFCIRSPYSSIALSAGHFKQTKNDAYIEAAINILTSLILVNFLGITGVAVGTLLAMIFRTIKFVIYLSKNILNRNICFFIKRCAVNGGAVVIIVLLINMIPRWNINSYGTWSAYAAVITGITAIVAITANAVFYSEDMKELYNMVKRIFVRTKE